MATQCLHVAESSKRLENMVDLAKVNKYVGYCDTQCKVTFDTVRADLRLAQINSGPYSNEVELTVIVMTINRINRTVTIDEMNGTRMIHEHELGSVRLANEVGSQHTAGDERANSSVGIFQETGSLSSLRDAEELEQCSVQTTPDALL